jgi:hypothetical protein
LESADVSSQYFYQRTIRVAVDWQDVEQH